MYLEFVLCHWIAKVEATISATQTKAQWNIGFAANLNVNPVYSFF